jgi:ABC-type phosphate transport system substrate-binding protein
MRSKKTWVGAAAFALVLSALGQACAQVPIYGGVSYMAPFVLRFASDCFGPQLPLYTPGSAPSTFPTGTYTITTKGGTSTTACGSTKVLPNIQLNLEISGARPDVQAFYQHSPSVLGAYLDSSGASATFPTLHFATTDLPIPDPDVTVYLAGGTTLKSINKTISFAAPGATPQAGQSPNPSALYGPMVQIPLFIAPIAIAFSPVYKKVVQANGTVASYSFHFTAPRTKNVGFLRLDTVTLCKIFNGQITNWNDPALAALNGAPILNAAGAVTGYTPINDPKDPDVLAGRAFSVPIELVGRSDLSGETMIFTRALAAQCGLPGVNNQYADASSTLPTALRATSGTATPGSGQFTTRGLKQLVASYVSFTARPSGAAGTELVQGRITYITPDWASPYNNAYGLAPTTIQSLVNPAWFLLPTPSTAEAAYSNLALPTDIDPTDPANWVQQASKTAPIAAPTTAAGYPIVGTENLLVYTCYADKLRYSDGNVGYRLNQFVAFLLHSPLMWVRGGILESNGFAPLPGALRNAAYAEFVSNANGDNLQISSKSDVLQPNGANRRILFAHNPVCDAYPGG